MKRNDEGKPKPGARADIKPEAGGQCRCKEVAKKTPLELLKLMLRDFAFWKKNKRGAKGP